MDINNEGHVLVLNQRIKKLLTQNETYYQENMRFNKEMEKYKIDLAKYKSMYMQVSQERLQYKYELNNETTSRQTIAEAHQKQKKQFLSIKEENVLLKDKLRILENVTRTQGPPGMTHKQVEVIGSIHDIKSDQTNSSNNNGKQIQELKAQIENLQHQLDEAYDLIDELEFEVESISYYENENELLNNRISRLQEEITEYERFYGRMNRDEDISPATSNTNEVDVSSSSPSVGGGGGGIQNENDSNTITTSSEKIEKQQKRAELHKKLDSLHEKQCANHRVTKRHIDVEEFV